MSETIDGLANEERDEAQLPFRDDEGEVNLAFVALVTEAVEREDADAVRALGADLHEADVGALIEHLEPEDRARFIALMGVDFDFTALTEVDDAVREEILDELPNETIAEGVRDLDSDDAVYIIEGLAQEDRDEVLEKLPALDSISIEKSLDYPEDSAGRRMQTEFIALPPFWTVGQTIDFMRTRRTCRSASTTCMSSIRRTGSSAAWRSTGCCARGGRRASRRSWRRPSMSCRPATGRRTRPASSRPTISFRSR